jgi:protein SCO1/2
MFFAAVGAGALVILLVFGGMALIQKRSAPPPAIVADASLDSLLALGDFSLTDQRERLVTRGDLQDKLLVVNFVFTGCSLSCMAVNDRMAEVQRMVAAEPDVQLLSITVDPKSDTPQALAKFSERFGADPNRWRFLTGEKTNVYSLLEKSFLGPPNPRFFGLVPGGFDGTHRIAIVDRNGKVRAMLNGENKSAATNVLQILQNLRDPNSAARS